MTHDRPLRLLLVEDNPGDARLLKEFLRRSGQRSIQLENSNSLSDCLSQLKRNPADLVLLDLSLPDGDGLQSLKQVRDAVPQVPVVIVTGNRDEGLAVESLKRGAQDYLVKGEITGELLVRSVRYALERFRLLQRLGRERARYELVAMGSHDGLWEWNLARGRVYFSPHWKSLVGCEDAEIGDNPEEWFKRIHPEDRPRVEADLDEHLRRKSPYFVNEHRLEHKNRTYRWVLSRGKALFDAKGKPVRMAGSFTDITDHKSLEERLDHQAHHDYLTGLPNRSLFMESLERSFARLGRDPDRLFAVLFMDMDRFKFINDSLGHLAGDRMLAELAMRLRACVRPSDLVARLGGDEFTVLLDDLREPSEATSVAERILEATREPAAAAGGRALGTVSIGIAFSNCGAASAEELLRDADRAMYRAKTLGKGRYEVFDQITRFDSIASTKLEKDLQQAFQNAEFFTLYQPVMRLKKGGLTGFEALLRWRHPRQGVLSPSRFMDRAEEAGFLGRLDEWALRASCAQAKAWTQGGYPSLLVSVNVSAAYLVNAVLLDLVPKILAETGLENHRLELEIPGWIVLKEKSTVLPLLREFHEKGIRLALDHSGIGFAALKEMRDLPIQNLKLDRDFIQGMVENPLDDSLARWLISAAHDLGLTVTATGVETQSELELLEKNGCDFVQGCLFSPPLSADEFTHLLAALPAGLHPG